MVCRVEHAEQGELLSAENWLPGSVEMVVAADGGKVAFEFIFHDDLLVSLFFACSLLVLVTCVS